MATSERAYDLIGDLHGHADELVLLLEQLGYDRRGGTYAHPRRKAIFVGDFIDRGSQIREVLSLVRPMVESGSALAVLGNHEFNALCYHTRDTQRPGEFLREHSAKNVAQHRQTILQLEPDELYETLEWFHTLPLWMEWDDLRVVHACWDHEHIATLDAALGERGGLTDGFLRAASEPKGRHDPDIAAALDEVLKGKEIRLPDGLSYADKDGHVRHHVRIRWYESPEARTYLNYALPSDPDLPDLPLPPSAREKACPYDTDGPPVFFGHYWLPAARPTILASNVACLDYSVAKGGFLCAYRWDGESTLSNDKFVCVKARH